MDISLGNRSEYTGRFNFVQGADGDVQFDDTQAHAVMTSAMEDKASWPFDETHGNDATALRSVTAQTTDQIVAMTLDAESPLENDGSIANLQVTARRSVVNSTGGARIDVKIAWDPPTGVRQAQETSL